MHCGSHMSWTGSASQDLESACSAAKISQLLQQLKPLYGLCEAHLLLLIGMHESNEERCCPWANLPSLGTVRFMWDLDSKDNFCITSDTFL